MKVWSLFLATFPLPPVVCLVVFLSRERPDFPKTEDSAKSHPMGLLRKMQKIYACPSTCSMKHVPMQRRKDSRTGSLSQRQKPTTIRGWGRASGKDRALCDWRDARLCGKASIASQRGMGVISRTRLTSTDPLSH